MTRIFQVDGYFFALLNRIANLFLLNCLFLITCIPIVTIGPALCALYQVSLKSVDDAYITVFKDYFKAFKEHFLGGTILFLIQFGIGAVVTILLVAVGKSHVVFALPLFLIAGSFLLYLPYSFALRGVQRNSLVNTIKSASYLMLANVTESIIMFGQAVVILLVFPIFGPKSLYFILFFGFALLAYLQACLLKKVFIKAFSI